ncbi:hypothetical protein Nos7524_3880 [Nostoc sp. PCC 7524]|uniref:hypothetical protein n=1 Tax=Nostoc sp. (strain ATCC 29411 / PCC 7524) TaxID=28072 RepID=UPI00029EF358|nr:hypothetical protein [Nostoc sp. PCC 7524]AFY49654.1 hypothetical protein Nos7524_3880 [Nostoc sp. PCC 7524]
MNGWTLLFAVIVAGLVLFIWSGVTQNLPWGIKSVKPDIKNVVATQAIASESQNGMMYLNGEIVAFVAVKPKTYYSPQRFFIVEFVTQILAGMILCLLLSQLFDLSLVGRQFIILLVSLLIVVTTDMSYWNWWGFSHPYTLGVAANKIIGLQLASLVVSLLFMHTTS